MCDGEASRAESVRSDTLQDLDNIAWGLRSPEVMLAMVRSLERLRSVVDGIELSVVAAIEATQAARADGWASTKDFVTAAAGGAKGSGRRTVALAGVERSAFRDRASPGSRVGLAGPGRGGGRGGGPASGRPGTASGGRETAAGAGA